MDMGIFLTMVVMILAFIFGAWCAYRTIIRTTNHEVQIQVAEHIARWNMRPEGKG